MNNALIELIEAIAMLLWPVCILIITFIFRKDISQLLNRIGPNKLSTQENEKDDKTSFELSYKQDASIPDQSEEESNEEGRTYHSEDELFLEVCKNIQSEDYFIVIEEIHSDEAKMITPKGEIKQLQLELFDELEEKNIKNLLEDNLISREQLLKFNEYIEKDADNYIEHYFQSPVTITSQQHAVCNEPHYIRNFRKMLNNPNTIPSRMRNCILRKQNIAWIDLKNILIGEYGYRDSGSFSASLRVLLIDGYVRIKGNGNNKMIIPVTEI